MEASQLSGAIVRVISQKHNNLPRPLNDDCGNKIMLSPCAQHIRVVKTNGKTMALLEPKINI